MEKNSNYSLYGRKASMTSTTKLAAFSVLATLPGINIAQSSGVLMVALTVQQVRDIIFKEISNAPFLKAVDQLHLGSLDQEVTGIVTTMFPTFEVINKTIGAGLSLLLPMKHYFITTRMKPTGSSRMRFIITRQIC